ncbi:MAG: transposase, partial [Verrucomicrobiota bacterium]
KHLPVLVPPAEGKPAGDNPYASQHFYYDPPNRTVTCPQGRPLDHEGHTTKAGQRVERCRCHCRDCPVRAQCTRDPKGRQIEIWPHAAVVQAMRAHWLEPCGQALYQQRSQIIERRFAQIKQHDGFRRWTVWGLEAVRTQWSLLCATLNLRILYRRWRQNWPTSPRTTAAMTGKVTPLEILPADLVHRVRKRQDAVEKMVERGCRWLPNWAA